MPFVQYLLYEYEFCFSIKNRYGVPILHQAGRYQQLFLIDEQGVVVSRDIPKILGLIKSGPEQQGLPLPEGYNALVMWAKHLFIEEVKHRQAEREHTLSLTHGQRYVLRELRILFEASRDEDIKGQINILEKAFRGPITRALVRELNLLCRNSIAGNDLFKTLTRLYHQHNMREWLDSRSRLPEDHPVPKIVCSEGLI